MLTVVDLSHIEYSSVFISKFDFVLAKEILLNWISKFRPETVFACDSGLSGRDILFPEYKKTRRDYSLDGSKITNEDERLEDLRLRSEFRKVRDEFRRVVSQQFRVLFSQGYEADDVIATIVKHSRSTDEVLIVASDRDLYPLLSDRVYIKTPHEIVTFESFYKKYALDPLYFVDLRSMTGDEADNVKGVYSIGEKRGLGILYEYETLENVLSGPRTGVAPKVEKYAELTRKSADKVLLNYKVLSLISTLVLRRFSV